MAVDKTKQAAAVIYANMERNDLGGRSRLDVALQGTPILQRTLERVGRAERVSEILIFCRHEQQTAVEKLAAGSRAEVIGLENSIGEGCHRRQRKWSLHNWRGGIHEATYFDEQIITQEMVQHLQERRHEVIVSVASEAVLVDPALLDHLIAQHYQYYTEMKFTFSQAAPGLGGCVYRVELLNGLTNAGICIGDVLAYSPKQPQPDFIVHECTYKAPAALYQSRFRFLTDTQRSLETLESLFARYNNGSCPENWDALEIVAAMEEYESLAERFPRELDIEITTEPGVRILGYPHREEVEVPQRGPMPMDLWHKIVTELGSYDDIVITLGGCGEPLKHPELPEMIMAAKEAGIYGINIETDGLLLEGDLGEKLAKLPVDVISVYLDAHSEELYRQVKGRDGYERVVRNIMNFLEVAGQNGALIVPWMTKTRQTMAEMEAFYDHWLETCGAAVIVGYNDYAGQIADQAVMNMEPPMRRMCQRLERCMTILADGSVPVCTQDFRGLSRLGNAAEDRIETIWQNEGFQHIRQTHADGRFEEHPLCPACKEWHR